MKSKLFGYVIAVCLCVGAILWAVWSPAPVPGLMADPPAVPAAVVPKMSAADRRAQRVAFYDAEVDSVLVRADRENRDAARRCLRTLVETFEGYRTGIEPFVEDINSWDTRFGVINRMPGDWWYEDDSTGVYVQQKFAGHLFSEEDLAAGIQAALDRFRRDVQANQDRMLVNIRAAISRSDVPNLPVIDADRFADDMTRRFEAYGRASAEQSLVRGLAIEVASAAGGFAVEQIIRMVAVKVAQVAARSATVAGGATAATTAAGGGGGSTVGPVGTAAGVVVGLGVGLVIDWWVSEKSSRQMKRNLHGMVHDMAHIAIDGTDNRPGLRVGLRGTCDLMFRSYRDTIRKQIVDGVGA